MKSTSQYGGQRPGGSGQGAKYPLRVFVMESDFFARMFILAMLIKDVRTSVCGEAAAPAEMLATASQTRPDLILISTAAAANEGLLGGWIGALRSEMPSALVVCLAETPILSQIRESLQAGANGYLSKEDTAVGLVPALLRAARGGFVCSPGVEAQLRLEQYHPRPQLVHTPAWQPDPELPPQYRAAILMRVFLGMSTFSTAKEMYLSPATIEKYTSESYSILNSTTWVDEVDLEGVDLDRLPREERAYHLLTGLPARYRPIQTTWERASSFLAGV